MAHRGMPASLQSQALVGAKKKSMGDLRDLSWWVAELWTNAEPIWIKRDGQDTFYRQEVIVPAIRDEIARNGNTRWSLIDLGAGDGQFTEQLVMALRKEDMDLTRIDLLDRSTRQLSLARGKKHLRGAHVHTVDLNSLAWLEAFDIKCAPKLVISIFLIQELPNFRLFTHALRQLLKPNDVAVVVTVAPEFSSALRSKRSIECVHVPPDAASCDWLWAGRYPIEGQAGCCYLPHFQRTKSQMCDTFRRSGLVVSSCRRLSISDDVRSRTVFSNTVYGDLLFSLPSSLLFVIEPNATEFQFQNEG